MKKEIILSLHSGGHDSAAALFVNYRLIAAISKERLTRKKCDAEFPTACIQEVLKISGFKRAEVDTIVITRGNFLEKHLKYSLLRSLSYKLTKKRRNKFRNIVNLMRMRNTLNAFEVFKKDKFLNDYGFSTKTKIFFSNHHFAHGLSAFFYTEWDNAIIYTADGEGDNVHYSIRIFKNRRLNTIYGDDSHLLSRACIDSIGQAYMFATSALGFKPLRHEGKVTGLAGYGHPSLYDELANHFDVLNSGKIISDFHDYPSMKKYIHNLFKTVNREDAAASIQMLVEKLIVSSIEKLVNQHDSDKVCLAGGVFANVRLNQKILESTKISEVFIFPAMGDSGLVIGSVLEYLLERDGLDVFLSNRKKLENCYLGRDYTDKIDSLLKNHPKIQKISNEPALQAAKLLSCHKVGAIYTGRMEFGPRALGNRSIIANPDNSSINKTLNKRLNRTDFMPFAPYIAEEDAKNVFDINQGNQYACKFMTITVNVKKEWRKKIPAVVHIDNTARPQVINKKDNYLYYSILKVFKDITGLPVLINTSLNVHEEPIINQPQECLKALLTGRVDFIVTNKGIYEVKS